jgi:hypothetical protein
VEVDFARRQLLVRGKAVDIAERTFDILELLVRAGGELVSKDELLERVWPGRFVGDNTLEVHICSLRKAQGKNRVLLKTLKAGLSDPRSWNLERAAEPRRPGASPGQATTGALRTNLPAQAKLIGGEVFRVGLALGREDDALAWELRAATSLARLHQRQGRQALARDVLAPVYRRLTEEFATADLREAQRLRKAPGR